VRIALLAPFEEPVPPAKYGGTELVVYNLAEELVRMGHDVTLFASGDSTTSAKLVAGTKFAVRTLPESKNPRTRAALNYEGLAVAIKHIQSGKFDIVHNHAGWQTLLFRGLIKCPIVTTLHGSLEEDTKRLRIYFQNERYMYDYLKDLPFVSISDSQRKNLPQLNYVATVYNGIDISRFAFNDKPDDYLAFLGRIHPQKGPEFAISIAKMTGNKLIMGAKIDPDDEDFYVKKVKPHIDGKQITFLGEIGHDEKVELLRGARAVISPIRWDEPFGLVNIEAMAVGTPVITAQRGSIPEIVVNKVTGYTCNSLAQMVRRVGQIDNIKRKDCRDHVEKNFTSRKMAESYLAVYTELLKKQK
jgi:glycosyltransferase involved in cell wall biosynthesis